MSGGTGTGGTDGFAELLRELKERSGLSYGTLAKRLHMSASTLHRYCNGTVVPTDYAPAERLARLCRATPQELLELHRRWILADASRGVKPVQQGSTAQPPQRPTEPTPAAEPSEPSTPSAATTPSEPTTPSGSAGSGDEPVVVASAPAGPVPPRRRRVVLIASVAAAAVLGSVVLAVNLSSDGDGGGGGDGGNRQAAGATAATTGAKGTGKTPSTSDSASPSASASGSPSPNGKRSHEPSAPASASAPAKGGGKGDAGGAASDSSAVPLTVAIRPYVYDSPCSQHFLVDSEPAQVGPPATEQDAQRWASAYGAVSSGEQRVALTVQGTGTDTVVLEALHVRAVAKGAPLAWNDYSMGVGCGGGVDTKSFDIDLDDGRPAVTVKNGQRDFPYKVSESDPEVFYVTAHAKAHDVRWDLTLDWSSGSRHGTLHIDNNGSAFRTSAGAGRPGYDYPLGGSEWIKREE
ncbi:helix-turn-helix domain-containing protein [Streptomyces sp. E11-3]|uniref:helix-turn-helix domain-containing protein n=1 Tax=Streptomyces sp. E11-3 TaxID=3110112 RepID=UPI003980E87F